MGGARSRSNDKTEAERDSSHMAPKTSEIDLYDKRTDAILTNRFLSFNVYW